uniref:C2 domain-containing protein n=2 Tax=Timema TaxID=61471 RepID=A0A7R9E0K4_9NEOP|nr:unnamed protein product [Timema monikensis]
MHPQKLSLSSQKVVIQLYEDACDEEDTNHDDALPEMHGLSGVREVSQLTDWLPSATAHLGLMCDALKELSELSKTLRHRNVGLDFANEKVKLTVSVFESRKSVTGTYYSMALEAEQNFNFVGVPLHKREGRKSNDPLDPEKFYEALEQSIEKKPQSGGISSKPEFDGASSGLEQGRLELGGRAETGGRGGIVRGCGGFDVGTFEYCSHKMPGKVKVKIVAGRNLPVMDRSSDNTDAYVEIKLGNTTFKTDVCRKSLNPQWNSEWYRFEADDSELQDEPLQIRLMDHDTYSANDAIGKVYLDLNPLLLPVVPGPVKNVWSSDNSTTSSTSLSGGAVMSGWIPVYDTMHGIRGEVNVIVKVELFSDFNKFRQSSCAPVIPYGYHAQVIHGFVEELVVNDDPEYQWIDKIRTPRASNEARQTLFLKLSGELQRKIGLKALDLGGNAVIGYQQCFDLEGESGIVVRGIGTAVTLVRLQEVTLQPPHPPLASSITSEEPKLQSDSSLYDETTSTVSCRSFTTDRPATFARSISQYEGSTKSKIKFWKQHIRSSSDSIAAALIRSLMDSTNTGLDSVAEVKESPGSSPTSPSRTGSIPTGDIDKLSFKKEVPLTRGQIPVSSESKTRFIPPTLEIFPESYLRLPFSEDGPELQYVDGHLIPNKSPALSSTSDSSSSDDDTSEEFSLDISSKEKTPFRPSPPAPIGSNINPMPNYHETDIKCSNSLLKHLTRQQNFEQSSGYNSMRCLPKKDSQTPIISSHVSMTPVCVNLPNSAYNVDVFDVDGCCKPSVGNTDPPHRDKTAFSKNNLNEGFLSLEVNLRSKSAGSLCNSVDKEVPRPPHSSGDLLLLQPHNIEHVPCLPPTSRQQAPVGEEGLTEKLSGSPATATVQATGAGAKISPSPAKISHVPSSIHRRSSDSDLSITPKVILEGGGGEVKKEKKPDLKDRHTLDAGQMQQRQRADIAQEEVKNTQFVVGDKASIICEELGIGHANWWHNRYQSWHCMHLGRSSRKRNSLTGSDRSSTAGTHFRHTPASVRPPMNQESLDMLEYPFLTFIKFPASFIQHLGGTVSSRSVKLLERITNLEEPETRDAWWTEIRMEVRSHARALGCNVVLGYSEHTSICDDVCVLSASGTAAVINLDADGVTGYHMHSFMPLLSGKDVIRRSTALERDVVVLDRYFDFSGRVEIPMPTPPQLCTCIGPGPPVPERVSKNKRNVVASIDIAVIVCQGSGQHHTRATTQHLHNRGELMTTSLDRTEFSDTNGKNTPQKNDHSAATVVNATKPKSSPRESVEAEVSTCSLCHIPYNEASVPFRVTMLKCAICRRGKVPDVLFTTIELPEGIPMTGTGCLLQAYVCRPKPYCKGEMNAKEISDGLPFLEYELHRLLINKLKVKGMNTIFGLRFVTLQVQVQIGEKMLVGLATGTAVFLTPLPPPPVPKVSAGNSWTDEKKLAEIQKQLLDTVKKNRETYQLKPISEVDLQTNGRFAPSDTEESDDELPDLDLAAGNKDTCVLEIDDAEDVDVVSLLMDPAPPEGFHVVNVETVPGLNEMEIVRNLQMFTQMWRAKIPVGQQASNLSEHFHRLLQAVYFKLRRMVPCALCDLQFSVELPEPDEMQLSVLDDSDMIFNLDDEHNVTETVLSVAPLQSQLGRVRPRSPQRVRIQPVKHQHTPPRERYGVDITPLSYVPGGKIEKYLGNLNFFFIRESTGIRECGGLSGFVHSFVTEVLAIVRAHVTALGGNAMVAYFISECILYHNPHKNQFVKNLSLKDTIYMVADSWGSLTDNNLKNAWKKLWLIPDTPNQGQDEANSQTQSDANTPTDAEVVALFQTLPGFEQRYELDTREWFESDGNDPGYQHLNDDEIAHQVIEDNDNGSNIRESDDDEEMDAEEAAGPSHSDAYEAFQTAMNWLERQPERAATQLVLLKRLRDMAAKRRVFCFATPQATLRTFVHESRLTTDIICACAYPHSWTVQMGTQPPTSLVFLSCWMCVTSKIVM